MGRDKKGHHQTSASLILAFTVRTRQRQVRIDLRISKHTFSCSAPAPCYPPVRKRVNLSIVLSHKHPLSFIRLKLNQLPCWSPLSKTPQVVVEGHPRLAIHWNYFVSTFNFFRVVWGTRHGNTRWFRCWRTRDGRRWSPKSMSLGRG